MGYSVFAVVGIWSWLVASAAVFVVATAFLFRWDDDWEEAALALLGQSLSVGLVVCSLVVLGHPAIAHWTWRVLSVIVLGLGLIYSVRFIRAVSGLAQWAIVTFFNLFSLLVLIAAFTSVYRSPTDLPASLPFKFVITASMQLDFWRTAARTILGLGAISFGLLFVAAMQRQGSLWFESHLGGLAGNIGGWRVSSSIGYLIGALLFALMFGTIVIVDSNPPRDLVGQETHPITSKSGAVTTPSPAASETSKERSATPVEESAVPTSH